MNRKLVRAEYESCLVAVSRLTAYATSKPFVDAPEVNERQDILAEDDLVKFCIHARRLIESVDLKSLVSSFSIKTDDNSSLSVWRIIGYLIHHNDLEIIRSTLRQKMLEVIKSGKSVAEFCKEFDPQLTKKSYAEPISPLVYFKSDKIDYTIISLEELMKLFSEKIIPAIHDKALDIGLILSDGGLKDFDSETQKYIIHKASTLQNKIKPTPSSQ